MNLDELKPGWHQFTTNVSARNERSINELDCLLPPSPPAYHFFPNTAFLLKNAAMYASIIILCGGC
ncbi:MAG: hypothetical protein AAF992_21985 [Bacteroidota bacterium]